MAKYRTAYSGQKKIGTVSFEGTVSKTQQHMAEETNINAIMKRARVTGQVPSTNRQPLYGDFSSSVDYLEALQIVDKAVMQFQNLPSGLRKRFQNNAAAFLEFCHDPKNLPEMVTLGLIKPPPKAEEPAQDGAKGQKGATPQSGGGQA